MRESRLECVNFRILNDRDQRIALLGGSPSELQTTRRSVLEMPTTVVLKHINYASQFLQQKLAEAIQSRHIVRLGANEKRLICCRFIFLFNNPPQTLSRSGDIIPELSKIISKYKVIMLPPLMKRKEDIPELAQHFFTQFQIQRRKQMDQNFLELLLHHKWDENILELKSFIKALDVPSAEIVIQQKDRIELAKMNLMIDESKEFSLKESISGLEKNIVIKALLKYNNIQSQTSKALGLANHTVKDIIRQ